MNAMNRTLSNAEAVKEYQNTVASDCESVSEDRKDKIFNQLITGARASHHNIHGDFTVYTYETALNDFTSDAKINELNKFYNLFSELRNEQNEAEKGNGDIKPLLAKVQALTDIIDTIADKYIDENYERICEYQDSNFDYAA